MKIFRFLFCCLLVSSIITSYGNPSNNKANNTNNSNDSYPGSILGTECGNENLVLVNSPVYFDTENNTVCTMNFEKEEFDESSLMIPNGLDNNVTHYWGICPQKEHVYILYSGRVPYNVAKENNKGIYYIFVEKFDWNSNPVAKYKLDRWGYFTVDENNNYLYLASANDDNPLYKYRLP